MRQQEIDEEHGGCNGTNDVSISDSGEDGKDDFDLSAPPRRSIHSDGSNLQRRDSSFSAQSSSDMNPKDEYDDHVSEMTPLIALTGDRAATELSPQILRPILRSLSEESIATVSALPGMVLRAHSIHVGAAGRHSEVTCSIRPSSTKAALNAVQQERRASRRKHEQQNSQMHDTPTSLQSKSSFTIKESYWIDIETPRRSTEELSEFLYQLRLPPFFVSILSEPTTWTSEVVALQFISLAIFQILPADPESDEIAHVALLSMPRLLVTFSTYPKNEQADGMYHLVHQYMKQRERVPEPTNSGLLLALLQFHVRRTATALRNLRARAVEMDNELDRDFQHFDFEDLVEAKDCLLNVLSVAEEQHGTIDALSAAEKGSEGIDFSNCSAALSVLQAHASSNERLSSRVDKHLNELRERIMAHREDNINQKMALLTILSAVFMPLTLLTGIWGMNFESMPELEMKGAYQKALLGMLILALSMVYSFQRAGFTAHH
mmetsp:Transcript_24402/g.40266  ORF Transcript_24402/g.40266 Transcript_24402/m.40266 type:complete len:491 (+) Transcript_24402:81-1553(+)